MNMIDAFFNGLFLIFTLKPFLLLLLGAGIGFAVGILPGLGGGPTLAMMIPFIYTMKPEEAFAFLLGMHSVVATTGDITSVLFGIPGESSSVATIVDGYAMTKKGEAGRALGAALMSSLVGAVIGAAALTVSIPIVRPLVLAFASPEKFMIILLGLACISSLSSKGKRGLLLGLLSGGLGLLCSLVGQDLQAGVHRFTFHLVYLWQGLPLVPVVIGLYAIAEIVDVSVRGSAIAAGDIPAEHLRKGVFEGIRDTFRHFWLTVRCALIGTWIGMLPGIGGGVSQWLAYAHAVQSARTSEERAGFGKGDVRGVLGPGAANNTTQGASLIPTIAFGIPGSFGAAIIMGAFLLLGIVPGPDMLTKYLPLTFSMVWTIVISNVIVVGVSLIFIDKLARLTLIRGSLMIPFLLILSFVGAYTSNNHPGDLILLLLFGGVGCLMIRFDWPRPPFVIGFILGNLAESYLYSSALRYGISMLLRPGTATLLCLSVLVLFYPFIQEWRLSRKEAETKGNLERTHRRSHYRWKIKNSGERIMSFSCVAIAGWVVVTAAKWPLKTRLFPQVIGVPVFFMALAAFLLTFFEIDTSVERQTGAPPETKNVSEKKLPIRPTLGSFFWFAGFLFAILCIGFPSAVPLFVFIYLKFAGKEKLGLSLGLTVGAWASFYGLFVWLLNQPFGEGWVQEGLRALGVMG